MICDGSYKINIDDNREAEALVINCIDTYRYAWGSFPTISNVANAYRS